MDNFSTDNLSMDNLIAGKVSVDNSVGITLARVTSVWITQTG